MLRDRHNRPLGTLRISVTDRCNLRCTYCMPEEDYAWLPNDSILTADEIEQVGRVFVARGVSEIRLTGGEPLLRHDLVSIVEKLARLNVDLALTTNGVLFSEHAKRLKQAGLTRITVSLDTLRPERALALSKTKRLHDVIRALDAANDAGFTETKINMVVMRGKNDDELPDMIALGKTKNALVRFIEYMDVGGATRWSMNDVVTRKEIVNTLTSDSNGEGHGTSPARSYSMKDGTRFGVIASTTAPFCGDCDRGRITADGMFFTCLYADRGTDLRSPLRARSPLGPIVERIWNARMDRGAEDRLNATQREVLIPVSRLRADLHREMHTRGG